MQSSSFTFTHIQYLPGQVTPPVKVLVIDDDNETTDLLKIILEENCFEVCTANSGPKGLDLARRLQPDVVVVDLFMPVMDGLRVCQEVRRFSNVPILVLSAIGKPGIAEQALNEGADDYLTKPMSSSVLIASLNKLARRARAEHAANGTNGCGSSL
jgi:two-component system, OmpR family, KDP operon response regulator KdpE